MGKVRRCNARCHNAKRPRCRCWCGGHFHGSGGAANRAGLLQAVNEAAERLHLEQAGFKEGETVYIEQKEIPLEGDNG